MEGPQVITGADLERVTSQQCRDGSGDSSGADPGIEKKKRGWGRLFYHFRRRPYQK